MNAADYRKVKDHYRDYYSTELDIAGDDYLQGQLQLVSAGLINYLPFISVTMHERIYREILMHKKLSKAEQAEPVVLDYTVAEGCCNEVLPLIHSTASIICTFHTGSYRVLNLFLYQQGVPFTLVMGKQAIEKEGAELTRLFAQLPYADGKEQLHLINAEATHAGIQMLRALKAGRTLVFYIDGNTGAGVDTVHNANSCIIDFLEQQLYARKGIAYLAHVAHVPLVPIVCYRKTEETICLHFCQPILPLLTEDREHFAVHTTQVLYKLAEPFIKQYPEQWEGWLYIHKTARIVKQPNSEIKPAPKGGAEKLYFDSARFGIFKMQGKPFLLEKHSYLFYEVSNELYSLLHDCTNEAILPEQLTEDVYTELKRKGVLVYL